MSHSGPMSLFFVDFSALPATWVHSKFATKDYSEAWERWPFRKGAVLRRSPLHTIEFWKPLTVLVKHPKGTHERIEIQPGLQPQSHKVRLESAVAVRFRDGKAVAVGMTADEWESLLTPGLVRLGPPSRP